MIATGNPDFISYDLLKDLQIQAGDKNKIIIDIAINYKDGKMCGDVVKDLEFIDTLHNVYVTPVPNGVGQLTVLALLETTIEIMEGQSWR